MKYFCINSEKNGTMYYEFYKGKWDEKTFWKENSLLIHDNVLYETGFENVIINAVPEFDSFNKTEITPEKWEEIRKVAYSVGGVSIEIVEECNTWINETFKEYGMFTILGI